MVTLRCDADGRLRWVKRYDGPAGGLDAGAGIVLDPSGNVVVTGFSEGIGSDTDYVVIKYRSGGKRLWEKRLNGPGNGLDRPYAIATDAAGNIYVTGYMFRSASALDDIATVKFSTNGSTRWVKYYGRGSASPEAGRALVVDGKGNVYVVGETESPLGGTGFTTIKYSKQGNRRWVKHYDGPAEGEDRPVSIGLDAANNVYVTGYAYSKSGHTDITTVKYTQ
jgi:hypothetical protein